MSLCLFLTMTVLHMKLTTLSYCPLPMKKYGVYESGVATLCVGMYVQSLFLISHHQQCQLLAV